MTNLNINDTVSLGRNIIAFVDDLKNLISSARRTKSHYLKYMHDRLVEQNTAFHGLASEYFSLVSRMRAATHDAKSSEELLAKYQSFMEDRDRIVVPRSELFGSFYGVERLLCFDAPVELRTYLNDYKEYLNSVREFFYRSTEQDGGSFFNDIFQKAYYAFDWKAGGQEIQVDWGNTDRLERSKVTVIDTIDEAKTCMETARHEVAKRFSYLQGRLAASL